jgi:membrane protein
LLLLIVSIGGLVVGPDGIQNAIADQAESLIGDSGKELVRAVFANADRSSGILATIFGLLILAFGATGVVAQLQDALNLGWNGLRKDTSRDRPHHIGVLPVSTTAGVA